MSLRYDYIKSDYILSKYNEFVLNDGASRILCFNESIM